MHETLFFICGGILAASAIVVSLFGLKNDNFPGKWMPLIILWFAVFAVGAGTFAVLHGKDESKEHDQEYGKASEEIAKADTTGPFKKAQKEEEEAAGSAEGGESAEGAEGGGLVEGEQAQEENKFEAGGEGEPGEAEAAGGGGNAELGAAVFGENCATCHGATGNGGNGGPDLNTMPLAQSEEGAIQQVTNGGGGMPAFEGVLSEEEIENVAAYVAQEITHGE
jgi:mono/diheme cytochrome c family protein